MNGLQRPLRSILATGLLLIAVALAGIGPSAASGAVRSGNVQDPADKQPPPNLDPSAPPPCYVPDTAGVAVSYDDAAGTLSITHTYYSNVSNGCNDSFFEGLKLSSCLDNSTPEGSVRYGRSGSPYASMDVEGLNGSLAGTARYSADGYSIVMTFSSPALAGKDWRCVETSSFWDEFATFYFNGYAPSAPRPIPPTPTPTPSDEDDGPSDELTSGVATRFLTENLGKRYGRNFLDSRSLYVKCPKEELFPETDEDYPRALCEFEFGYGAKTFRGGYAIVENRLNELSIVNFSSRTYTKKMRTCRINFTRKMGNRVTLRSRKLRATESLGRPCSSLVNSAGMAADLEYPAATRYPRALTKSQRTVGFHGTNRAGFEERVRFPCKQRKSGRKYSFDCRNELGDRFTYSFLVTKATQRKAKPKARSRPRPSRPHPSRPSNPYANVRNCSDTTAKNFPTPPGDPNGLDGDNDGVACES